MSDGTDKAFLEKVKGVLEQSEQQLDNDISRRLQIARSSALNSRPTTPWWVGATGIAVTAGMGVLAINLWINQPLPPASSPFEDMELLSSEQSLEFYRELEFYQWLEDEEHQG